MKKLLLKILVLVLLLYSIPIEQVRAGTCTSVGECVDGQICKSQGGVLYKGNVACGDNIGQNIIGGVTPPKAIRNLNLLAQMREENTGSTGIGIVIFLSRVLRLFTIVTGLLVILNTLYAAYLYISDAGSADVMTKVKDKFTMTTIGLAIIVGAYTLAAIVGLIFFGRADFIISPELYSALDQAP